MRHLVFPLLALLVVLGSLVSVVGCGTRTQSATPPPHRSPSSTPVSPPSLKVYWFPQATPGIPQREALNPQQNCPRRSGSGPTEVPIESTRTTSATASISNAQSYSTDAQSRIILNGKDYGRQIIQSRVDKGRWVFVVVEVRPISVSPNIYGGGPRARQWAARVGAGGWSHKSPAMERAISDIYAGGPRTKVLPSR